MTLQELGEAVGCARSYLSAVENEQRAAPSAELLSKIEKVLGCEPGSLIEAAQWQQAGGIVKRRVADMAQQQRAARELVEAIKAEGASGLDQLYRSGVLARMIDRIAPQLGASAGPVPVSLPVEVPLINSVAAGYPSEFTDLGYPARVADEYVRTPDISDPDAFAARVVGDSMEPQYLEGDIVVFSPARGVRSGMDCFVRLETDAQTTFKRVFFQSGERGEALMGALGADDARRVTHIRLQPLNANYPARVVEREQVAGLYGAVSVTRAIG